MYFTFDTFVNLGSYEVKSSHMQFINQLSKITFRIHLINV